MNADGTKYSTLTSVDRETVGPTWSHDRSKIAFYSNNPEHQVIWAMNADGSGSARLTTGPDNSPAWSPDGAQIAFQRAQPPSLITSDLWIANADGSGHC